MKRKNTPVQLIIVGSIGIDTIETPFAKREKILGGSASYACAAASFFAHTGLVGVVGTDFPAAYRELYEVFGIDLEGLRTLPGETFRWSGVYATNMDERRTLSTELNVFASFSPELPASYRQAPFVFLGNISPALQCHVLDQVGQPRFVGIDTMDLWIKTARADLLKVIGRVDMLTLNESEARQLTDSHALLKAAKVLLGMGPRYVLIKKGEHGSILFSKDSVFLMPAYPLEDVKDPTGAGDTFAGGLMGSLAAGGEVSDRAIRNAMIHGSVLASFGVEEFSLDRLAQIDKPAIRERVSRFKSMLKV